MDTPHDRLIEACLPAASLIDASAWFSQRVSDRLQGRDPWTLTLLELRELMEGTDREPPGPISG